MPGPVRVLPGPVLASRLFPCLLLSSEGRKSPTAPVGSGFAPRGSRVSPAPPTSRPAALVTRQPGKDAVVSSRLGGCGRASPEQSCQGSG